VEYGENTTKTLIKGRSIVLSKLKPVKLSRSSGQLRLRVLAGLLRRSHLATSQGKVVQFVEEMELSIEF
jgi:hypothetical protein